MPEKFDFHIREVDGKLWGSMQRITGDPADVALHEVLRWVLEQLNFGNWSCDLSEAGEMTALTLGLSAAADVDTTTVAEVEEGIRRRLLAVNLAGLFAGGREQGTRPEEREFAEEVRLTATEDGYNNTELHYAFELLDILRRIRSNTFVFGTPPTLGVASPEAVAMLREATRAYLFNLRRSCVAICRALLEDVLKGQFSSSQVLTERTASRSGELEALIELSARAGVLNEGRRKKAHRVRTVGNRALHGEEPNDALAWEILIDARDVVEAVCIEAVRPNEQRDARHD